MFSLSNKFDSPARPQEAELKVDATDDTAELLVPAKPFFMSPESWGQDAVPSILASQNQQQQRVGFVDVHDGARRR